MQDWRGALCAAILAATLAVSPSNAPARYCSPACWGEHRRRQRARRQQPRAGMVGITAAMAILAWLIGHAAKPSLTSRQAVREAIETIYENQRTAAFA